MWGLERRAEVVEGGASTFGGPLLIVERVSSEAVVAAGRSISQGR